MKNAKIIVLSVLLAACILLQSGCQAKEEPLQLLDEKNPVVTIEMENGGKIFVELYPDVAPNTVNNFIWLVERGFYDGVIYHRVIPDFMVQGGDPDGTGMGGPGYMIKGEFTNNSFQNDLMHTTGVISMARQGNPYDPPSAYNTAGSQFFIMVADVPQLDNDYASFGKVVRGMDVVSKIVNQKRDGNDRPLTEQKMKKVTVDTKGVDYPDPEIIPE